MTEETRYIETVITPPQWFIYTDEMAESLVGKHFPFTVDYGVTKDGLGYGTIIAAEHVDPDIKLRVEVPDKVYELIKDRYP